jgi:SAM-dependent methyltransferase
MSGDDMPWRWYEDYQRGRPDYPPAVADTGGLPASATVLDLAAGTGKLTRLLVSRFARVVAVEPDINMRRLLKKSLPEAEALDGSAERIPLADDSVDAVFVGQAFHWFDDECALTEIARVLRAHGALVVTWNVPTGPGVPSIAAVEELLAPHWPNEFGFPLDMMSQGWTPRAWQLSFARSTFDEIQTAQLSNPQTLGPAGLMAFFGSMGWIANLPDEDRLPLLGNMRQQLTATRYVLPWETRIHWTRLSERGSPPSPGLTWPGPRER